MGNFDTEHKMLDAFRDMPESYPYESMTLEEALAFPVMVHVVRYKPKRPVTLRWLVDHRPAYIEHLMQQQEPGTELFHAVCLVYDANVRKICVTAKKDSERVSNAVKIVMGMRREEELRGKKYSERYNGPRLKRNRGSRPIAA